MEEDSAAAVAPVLTLQVHSKLTHAHTQTKPYPVPSPTSHEWLCCCGVFHQLTAIRLWIVNN